MSNSFKVSIPSGSLLEQELEGKKGRQRQQRLYFLAEFGAAQLRGTDNTEPPAKREISITKQTVAKNKKAGVQFPASDLLSM